MLTYPITRRDPLCTHWITVHVSSDQRFVTFAIKPFVIEFELRQERFNRAVRLGYVPPSCDTSGWELLTYPDPKERI